MKYIIIGIPLLVVVIYLFLRRKRGRAITKLLTKPLSAISEEEKQQDFTNCKYVSDIIHGNYRSISGKKKRKSIKAFERWQQKQKFLFRLADAKVLAFRNKYARENKSNEFKPTYVHENPCRNGRPSGWQLFLKNGFTEPFPSLHDMDDWAVSTQLADIFLLNQVSEEDSKRFVFHEKRRYVNHDMVKAIIQFDLYKIPA